MSKQNKKLIFFDLDGTLVDFKTHMPKSTTEALRQAQKNGHKIFLCTGRGKRHIYDFLLNFGFDGIVAGTGCYVEYNDKLLYHKHFSKLQFKKLMDHFKHGSSVFVIENSEVLITAQKYLDGLMDAYQINFAPSNSKDSEDKDIISNMDVLIDNDVDNYANKYDDIENMCYAKSPLSVKELSDKFSKYGLSVKMASFKEPDDYAGEITLLKYSKSYAIDYVVNHLGYDKKDVVAFGDGANDVDMLQDAHLGIAMGNAIEQAKKAADYVTDDINKDGIYNAMKKFNII